MAVTIHIPQIPRQGLKRLAMAGVAALAAAAVIVGVQAFDTSDSVTTSSTSDSAATAIDAGIVDTSALKAWAIENNVTGLSPASAAPIAEAAAGEVTGGLNPAAAAAGVGLVAVPETTVEQGTAGFATHNEFLAANTDSFATAAAPATSYDLWSALREVDQAVLTETYYDLFPALRSVEQSVVATTGTEATYDPYPAVTEGPAVLPRSNFGSDLEWIQANGWADPVVN